MVLNNICIGINVNDNHWLWRAFEGIEGTNIEQNGVYIF
jgi:hypothetical protein